MDVYIRGTSKVVIEQGSTLGSLPDRIQEAIRQIWPIEASVDGGRIIAVIAEDHAAANLKVCRNTDWGSPTIDCCGRNIAIISISDDPEEFKDNIAFAVEQYHQYIASLSA
ncbi:hypothetical protein HYZ76_02670 [Candidatus Falkowbacteria bacterium]|nr:hypothetical protein [Candidatus Falkowbacteria bacterium]